MMLVFPHRLIETFLKSFSFFFTSFILGGTCIDSPLGLMFCLKFFIQMKRLWILEFQHLFWEQARNTCAEKYSLNFSFITWRCLALWPIINTREFLHVQFPRDVLKTKQNKKPVFYWRMPISNVVIISGGQQRDSAVCTHVSIFP